MKKIFIAGAAAVLCLSLAACGNKNKDNNTTGGNAETTTRAPETTAQAPTTTQVPSETVSAGDDNGANATDELLTRIHASVQEAYGEEYVPDMSFDESYLEAVYGITADMYDAFIAEGPMISVNIDTFIGIKAKSGKEQDVYKAMESYMDYLINDSMQYPTNAIKVQASQLIQHGEYIFFVCLGTIDMDVEEQGDEAILAQAQEKNQIAVDVIDSFFEK